MTDYHHTKFDLICIKESKVTEGGGGGGAGVPEPAYVALCYKTSSKCRSWNH